MTGVFGRLTRIGLGVLALGIVLPAAAHEVRPGYLEIRAVQSGVYDILWKVPARGGMRLSLDVVLPDACERGAESSRFSGGAYLERWQAACPEGLAGQTISIDGLEATRTDVLARVLREDGSVQTARLTPDIASFTVTGQSSWQQVASAYFVMGVEHILLGIDHLLFVLALVFLVTDARRLVWTITAFTLAHSLTLAASTLGWVHVPQAPVEAVIALSIVFVAAEILHARAGRPALAVRAPWLVAVTFGLLHGFGFAGALQEVGLPADAIPPALLFFNLGVEAGQLLFIGVVLVLLTAVGHVVRGVGEHRIRAATVRLAPAVAYLTGSLAAFWVIERTAGFWA